MQEVVANYSLAGIPLETQWVDIDYMDRFLDFTTDPDKFNAQEMKGFIEKLHSNGQHFVPIVDPGIYAGTSSPLTGEYPAYVEGMAQNVFVKDLMGQSPVLGQVWPGPTHFPDWFAANATSYWTEQLKAFHDLIPYDGIWIDMNEVPKLCNYTAQHSTR